MPRFELSDSVALRALEPDDAGELYSLVERNRSHLARWMPWAHGQTVEGTSEFIRTAIEQERDGNGFQVAVVVDRSIAGVLGFHAIDRANATATLGYWLAERHQGQGLMTAAAQALVEHAFCEWRLHRVEIRAAPENARSRTLAERLGFRQEGVMREAERFGAEYRDLVLYARLAGE